MRRNLENNNVGGNTLANEAYENSKFSYAFLKIWRWRKILNEIHYNIWVSSWQGFKITFVFVYTWINDLIYPIVSSSFIEKTVFSPLSCLHIFVKNQVARYVWIHRSTFFFWLLFHSLDCWSFINLGEFPQISFKHEKFWMALRAQSEWVKAALDISLWIAEESSGLEP